MSTAYITPQRDGSAVLELNGVTHLFDSWRAAADEADAKRVAWRLDRFPPPSPVVLASALP